MQQLILSPIVLTVLSEVTEVALLVTALMVALNQANVTGEVSVGNASGDIPAQKQSTEAGGATV